MPYDGPANYLDQMPGLILLPLSYRLQTSQAIVPLAPFMLFPPKGERGCVAPTRQRTIRRTPIRTAVLYVIGYLERQQTYLSCKTVVKFKSFRSVLVAEIA